MSGPAAELPSAQPGYYGKLPARGDFVGRRLAKPFLEAWDPWLQAGIAASRGALGEAWLDLYLHGPVWRFAFTAQVAGPAATAGVLMPSVDSVGRYFPLTIAAETAGAVPFALAAEAAAWFQAAEDLALGCLEEPFDLEIFDRRVAALGAPRVPGGPGPSDEAAAEAGGVAARIPEGGGFAEAQGLLADRIAVLAWSRYSLWWTEGAQHVPPIARAFPGLPEAESFKTLLTFEPAAAAGPTAAVAAQAAP